MLWLAAMPAGTAFLVPRKKHNPESRRSPRRESQAWDTDMHASQPNKVNGPIMAGQAAGSTHGA